MVSPIRTRPILSVAEGQAGPEVPRAERVPFAAACEATHAAGLLLVEEAAGLGQFRSALRPEDVEQGPDGPRLGVPDPAVLREDPRELSYALGALLYTLVTGTAPPRRQSLPMGHERALRKALAANGVDGAQAELIRRLMGWDTTRRPWPEGALDLLRAAGAVVIVAEPELAPAAEPAPAKADDPSAEVVVASMEPQDQVSEAPTELAPEPPTELASEPPTELATEPPTGRDEQGPAPHDVYAVGSDHELLFIPDAGTPPGGVAGEILPQLPLGASDLSHFPAATSSAREDGFTIPDHTQVVTFPRLFTEQQVAQAEDEVTDSEGLLRRSADDRTDPENRVAPGLPMDDTNPSTVSPLGPLLDGSGLDGPSGDDRSYTEEQNLVASRDSDVVDVLEPVPAPSQIRLEDARVAPAPARRNAPVTRPPPGAHVGRWIGLGLVILAVVMGIALASRP